MKKSLSRLLLIVILTTLPDTTICSAPEQSSSLTTQLMRPEILVPVALGVACSAAVVTRLIYYNNKASDPVRRPAPQADSNRAQRENPHQEPPTTEVAAQDPRQLRRNGQRHPTSSDDECISDCVKPLRLKLERKKRLQKERERETRRREKRQRRRLARQVQAIQTGIGSLPEEQIEISRRLRDLLIFRGLKCAFVSALPSVDPGDRGEMEKQAYLRQAGFEIINIMEKAGMQRTLTAAQLFFDKEFTSFHKFVTECAIASGKLGELIAIVKLFAPKMVHSDSDNSHADRKADDSDDDENADADSDSEVSFDGVTTSSERE